MKQKIKPILMVILKVLPFLTVAWSRIISLT